MGAKDVNVQIGPGFLGMLALLFVTLKLTGHLSWPWLWVLAPIWLPVTIFVVIILILLIIALR